MASHDSLFRSHLQTQLHIELQGPHEWRKVPGKKERLLLPSRLGWHSCNENCPKGAHGAGCSSECQCVEENTLECSAKNGSCTCKSGYQGNRCQKDGLWGQEYWFSYVPCENGGQRNRKTGSCDCTPGYTGKSGTI
ncbi:putative EGF-like and EMI domain-containing protein 1 isoform X2 [Cebus imitator]|nr:putative EGF-like and EMI domain-containing protein 1 isoform X2 [Cebus imitator]